MKRIVSFLMLCFICTIIFGQDIIIKRDGDQLKSKIIEITIEFIKYKDFEFLDGPIRNVKISDVFMVLYENGKREIFTATQNQNPKQAIEKEDPINKEPPRKVYKGNYFMIGTGYGNSYGGIGLRLQGRLGRTVGFGLHAGVGSFLGEPVLASVGVKFFPYEGFYINDQFDFRLNAPGEHAIWRQSLLIGIDQVWGKKVGIGFNAGLGASYNLQEYYFTPAADMGFLIRF